jgi:beta-glucuronidase
MLRPQDTATRERKALDGLWCFRLDADGVGRTERWFAGPLRDTQDLPVQAWLARPTRPGPWGSST